MNEGATRVEIATGSKISTSGFIDFESIEYHGRFTFSVFETYKQSEREVGTPSAYICSCAKNSLILERNTARPSPPRQ